MMGFCGKHDAALIQGAVIIVLFFDIRVINYDKEKEKI